MLSRLCLIAMLAPAFAAGSSLAAAAPVRPTPSLDGASFDQVRAALGEPDVAQTEGAGALWTWRLETCALMIAFRDGPGGFHVAEVMSGPRRRGDAPISPAQCVATAQAAHRNPKTQSQAPHR